MSIIGTIYEDVTTDVLGRIGVWQWLVVLASTGLMIPAMFHPYGDMFLLEPPAGSVCVPPENQEVFNASLCTVTSTNNATEIACTKWNVKLFWLIWLKRNWLAFCDSKIKLVSATMISRMGLMFGCVTLGLMADSFGRRTAIMVDLFAQFIFGFIITFCDSRAWFQLLVFLKALFGAATIYMGLILTCEISSNGWRSRMIAISSLPRLVAMTSTIPLASSFPNLETYNFMETIFILLLIISLRWTPESPQWLLFNRKIPKAEKILFRAAKTNRINLCEDFKIRPVNHRAYTCLDETRLCARIFTTYNTVIIISVLLLFWAMISFQLSYLYAKMFSEHNVQINLLVLICSTTVLVSLTVLLAKKMLLRYLLLFNILLSGISSASKILLNHIAPILTAIALASKIVVFMLLLNITPRLFAINMRATLCGCCHAVGQLGTAIAYLVFVFQPLNDLADVAVDLSMTMVLITLCLVLLDVDGRELPDLLEDMDYFSELSKPLRWATQKTNSPSNEEVEMRIYSFGSGGRNVSHNRSQERLPAERIGFKRFWRRFVTSFSNPNITSPIVIYLTKITTIDYGPG